MNIPEWIKNMSWFDFKEPLDSEKMKYSSEYYVLLLLKVCFGNRYHDYVLRDSPDLQNKEMTVGIEVVRLVYKDCKKIDGEFIKHQKGNKKSKGKIEKLNGKINELGYSYPVKYSEDDVESLTGTISKKINKVSSYRQKGFEKLGLAIVSEIGALLLTINQYKEIFD